MSVPTEISSSHANLEPMSEDVKLRRKTAEWVLRLAQVASVVALAVSFFFLLSCPTLFRLLLTGIVTLGVHDVYRVAENCIEIFLDSKIEKKVKGKPVPLLQQIEKNTWWVPYLLPLKTPGS
mgnify:CR=1 FL=1